MNAVNVIFNKKKATAQTSTMYHRFFRPVIVLREKIYLIYLPTILRVGAKLITS